MKLRSVSLVIVVLAAAVAGVGYWQTRVSEPFKAVLQSCLDTDAFDGRAKVNSQEAYTVCMTAARIQSSTWQDREALTRFARSFEIVSRASAETDAESAASSQYSVDTTPDGRRIEENHRQEMLAARRELNAARVMIGLPVLKPLYGEPGFTFH